MRSFKTDRLWLIRARRRFSIKGLFDCETKEIRKVEKDEVNQLTYAALLVAVDLGTVAVTFGSHGA